MTTIAGNISSYPAKAVRRERLSILGILTVGASGAVGSEDNDDPGVAFTKNGGTGDYTMAFPTAPRGSIRSIFVKSAAGTIKGFGVIAFDPVAGTLNFITHNGGGTATNPANGDVVYVELSLDTRSS